MGCGLPYAIGASFAKNRETVYCITGDGGLQMNIQELQTVASERLPIKIIVINNKVLGKFLKSRLVIMMEDFVLQLQIVDIQYQILKR